MKKNKKPVSTFIKPLNCDKRNILAEDDIKYIKKAFKNLDNYMYEKFNIENK